MEKKRVFQKSIVGLVFFISFLCSDIFFTLPQSYAAEEGETLLMATTTSTDNTGLLDYLMPSFTTRTGIDIRWTAP